MVSEQQIENDSETSRARIFPKSYARFIRIYNFTFAHPIVNELHCSPKEMALRDAITKAVRDESISGFDFVRLTKWEDVLNQIADKFLRNGTRDLKSIWLWESFREPITFKQPDDPLQCLRDSLDSSTDYWFIATEDDSKYWIAEATGGAIIRVIEEMYGFEYYVVDRGMNWILCENHHSVFIQSDQPNRNGEQGADDQLPARLESEIS